MGHLPCPVGRFSMNKPHDPPHDYGPCECLISILQCELDQEPWSCTLPIGFSLGLNPVKGCVHRSLSFPPSTVRQQPLLEVQASGSWHIHITISSWKWVFTGGWTWFKIHIYKNLTVSPMLHFKKGQKLQRQWQTKWVGCTKSTGSHVCYVAIWFVPELPAQFDNMPHIIADISRCVPVCCWCVVSIGAWSI